MNKLVNISTACKLLDLIDTKNNKPKTYILRYWEKEFKEIKPKKINNRRYYSFKQLELAKKIKFLLKNKGLTILGVKRILSSRINELDDTNYDSLKASYNKDVLREKSKIILKKINKLKNYGKKNSP